MHIQWHIYIYIYMYTHTYIHTYVHAHICTGHIFTKISPIQKKHYISEEAWTLIENRQTARANGNTALEAQLNDSIKRLVKRDKKRWKLDLLEDFSTSKSKWSGIKLQKSDFKPTFYNLRDINGR